MPVISVICEKPPNGTRRDDTGALRQPGRLREDLESEGLLETEEMTSARAPIDAIEGTCTAFDKSGPTVDTPHTLKHESVKHVSSHVSIFFFFFFGCKGSELLHQLREEL